MRAPALLPVLLATLSACAMHPSPAYLSPQGYDDGPLRARVIAAGLGGISFHVNQPAYVTVFEVHPGGEVSLVHPRYGQEDLPARAGMQTVWRGWSHYDTGWRQREMFTSASYWGSLGGRAHQPRVYLLIASERPLSVSRYQRSPFALRMALGNAYFSANPHRLVSDLARLVVPEPGSTHWVSDVYYQWPDRAPELTDPIPVHVLSCRDGSQLLVPYYVRICPQDMGPAAQPEVGDTTAAPGDGRPQRPDRRRPVREDVQTSDGRPDASTSDVTRPTRGARPEQGQEPDATQRARPERVRDGGEEGRTREPGARSGSGERVQPPSRSAEPRAMPPSAPANPPERQATPPPAPPSHSAPPRSDPSPAREEPGIRIAEPQLDR